MEDPKAKVLVAEVRKLSMDENAAQMRRQKATVESKLRGRRRELSTILTEEMTARFGEKNSRSESCKE